MAFSIEENEQKIIEGILNQYTDYIFYYYGSRVKGLSEKTSDLDILIKGKQEMPLFMLQELKEKFDACKLPYVVNFSDYFKISENFYNRIKPDLIPYNWQEVKLGDVCEITSSKRIFMADYVNEGIPFYRSKEIIEKQKGNHISTELFITEEKYEEIKQKFSVPQEDDLLLTSVGTLGIPYIVKPNEKFYFKDGNLTWIKKSEKVLSSFLYYLLISEEGKHKLENISIGTTQKAITIIGLKNIIVPLPPLDIQKKIAGVLGALDDKIEMNNKINQNLEAQAQALFKSWFIDFEPFGGTMPTDWKVGRLGDFIEIKRGGSPRPIQEYLVPRGLNWLKISDATAETSPYIVEIKEHIKSEGVNKTVFLKKGSLVLSNSATPGIPKFLNVDSCIHDGWLYFPESKFSNEYLYLLFKYIRKDLVSLGNGSVFTNLKTDILKNFSTLLPTDKILKNFDNIISNIFALIKNNREEITSLSSLRDALLPKLMSGEINIDEVKID